MDWVGVEPTTSAMLKFYPDTGKPMTHHDDAVKVAPESYKVVLENDAVRVLEVRIKQGAKSEMHSHPKSVAICLNDQRLRFTFPNGKSEDADLKRGQAVWLDGLSHAVENVGSEDVSSVVVELMTLMRTTGASLSQFYCSRCSHHCHHVLDTCSCSCCK